LIKGFRQPAGGLAELDRQYDCACDLITVGRRKEAETLLCGILKKYPSHFGALCSLGAIRLEQAQVDEAMQLFRRAASYRRVSSTLRHLAWEFSDFLPLSFGRLAPAC